MYETEKIPERPMTPDEPSNIPPYLSFTTFQAAISGLRAHGLPDKLDRSAWTSRSGAEQGQIVSGLKFLGLIDKDGITQQALRDLVSKPPGSPDEKAFMSELIRSRYSEIFDSLDVKSATPKQLEDAIANYGPTGATKGRAVRFFIKAAGFSEIPLSPRLTRGLRTRSAPLIGQGELGKELPAPPRPRRRRRAVSSEDNTGEEGYGSAVKTVTLRLAGGELTLSGTFNPLELEGDERALVYGIVDLMKAYERASVSAPAGAKENAR
jgi:hypothetical protein